MLFFENVHDGLYTYEYTFPSKAITFTCISTHKCVAFCLVYMGVYMRGLT